MTKQQNKEAEIDFWARLPSEESIDMSWLAGHLERVNWNGIVLDAGCGRGNLAKELQRFAGESKIEIVGVDLSPDMLGLARDSTGLQFVHADLEAMPFADGSFDIIICSETLHHFPDFTKASAELNRVLKPGGQFVLIDHHASLVNKLSNALGRFMYRYQADQTRTVNEQLHSSGDFVKVFEDLRMKDIGVVIVDNSPALKLEISYFRSNPKSILSFLLLARGFIRKIMQVLPGAYGSNVIIFAHKSDK